MRPVVHSLAAWRCIQRCRRGREDEPVVFHQRDTDREDLVLRPVGREGGKKTPLTLKHFEDFAAKLASRVDSERSWTVDLAARQAKASADVQPFKDLARA